jgi:hypothetical protein
MIVLGFALNAHAQEVCANISDCKALQTKIQTRLNELGNCAKETKAQGTVRDSNGCVVGMVFSSEIIKSIKASPKYSQIRKSHWTLEDFGSAVSNSEIGAVEYCASLGMRLPTLSELSALFSSGNLEGYRFWASDSINSDTVASTYRALTWTDTINNFGRTAFGDSSVCIDQPRRLK